MNGRNIHILQNNILANYRRIWNWCLALLVPKIPVFDGRFSHMGKQLLINIPLEFHELLEKEGSTDGNFEFDIVFKKKNAKNTIR